MNKPTCAYDADHEVKKQEKKEKNIPDKETIEKLKKHKLDKVNSQSIINK